MSRTLRLGVAMCVVSILALTGRSAQFASKVADPERPADTTPPTPPKIQVSVSDAAEVHVPPGAKGLTARFLVTLSGASTSQIKVFYTTANGTAGASWNFERTFGWLTFAPGQTTKSVSVPILADAKDEGQYRVFFVEFLDFVNVTAARSRGEGSIYYEKSTGNGELVINVSNAPNVPATGKQQAQFTVTLSGKSTSEVTAVYSTANGTAGSGWDYGSTFGVVKFKPGETTKVIQVPVYADDDGDYSGETFFLGLLSVNGAKVGQGRGETTIIENPGK